MSQACASVVLDVWAGCGSVSQARSSNLRDSTLGHRPGSPETKGPKQEPWATWWAMPGLAKPAATAKPGRTWRPMNMYSWGVQKQKSPGSFDQGLCGGRDFSRDAAACLLACRNTESISGAPMITICQLVSRPYTLRSSMARTTQGRQGRGEMTKWVMVN